MSPTVYKTPLAAADLIEIASFIAEDNLDAVERFLDAAEETFAHLAAMPLMGRTVPFQHPQAQDMRVWRVRGVANYLIFYRAVAQGIEVIRVLHAARDIEGLFAE
jgi:toxin ParE1/3/4